MRKFPTPGAVRVNYGAAEVDACLDFEEYGQARPLPPYFYKAESEWRQKLIEDGGLKLAWLPSGECNKLFHGAGVQLLDKYNRVLFSASGLDERDALDLVIQYIIRLEAKHGRHWLLRYQDTGAANSAKTKRHVGVGAIDHKSKASRKRPR